MLALAWVTFSTVTGMKEGGLQETLPRVWASWLLELGRAERAECKESRGHSCR